MDETNAAKYGQSSEGFQTQSETNQVECGHNLANLPLDESGSMPGYGRLVHLPQAVLFDSLPTNEEAGKRFLALLSRLQSQRPAGVKLRVDTDYFLSPNAPLDQGDESV